MTTAGVSHIALVVAAVLAAALAGCADDGGNRDVASEPPDPRGSWHLVSGRDAQGTFRPLSGRKVTLVWDAEGVGGTSGCNLYGATVSIDREEVRFGKASGTEMACGPDVMEVERRYLAALTAGVHLQREFDVLTLSGPDVALEFELGRHVEDSELIGPTWRLESLVDDEAVSSAAPGGELRFLRSGILEGNSGCRRVHGRFEVRDGRVAIEDFEDDDSERPTCPDVVGAQHGHVLSVLYGGFTAEVEGDRLSLTTPGGLGLELRAG